LCAAAESGALACASIDMVMFMSPTQKMKVLIQRWKMRVPMRVLLS
jgi:hypothetical protein